MPPDQTNDLPIWVRVLMGCFCVANGPGFTAFAIDWMRTETLWIGLFYSALGIAATCAGVVELVRCYRCVR
jgi:hypothetical protein